MHALSRINIGLRAFMELGILLGLGYWGFHTGDSTFLKFLLGIGAPVTGFGFWGLVDFHNSGKYSEWYRLMQELVVTGLAAILLFNAGKQLFGLILAFLSVIHHALVYILGERLLK